MNNFFRYFPETGVRMFQNPQDIFVFFIETGKCKDPDSNDSRKQQICESVFIIKQWCILSYI